MITVTLDKSYRIPTRWSEMTPHYRREFLLLCRALDRFERGSDTFDQMRCKVTLALLGIDGARIRTMTEEYQENIFRLSELVHFPYRIVKEGTTTVVYPEISLRMNLLPTLPGREGYLFDISGGGVADCDITAEQYIDAVQLMQVYSRTRDRQALHKLVEVLYRLTGSDSRLVTADEEVAVYYNFRGILEFVRSIPSYDLIFNGAESSGKGPSSPLGMSGSIFAMAKAGYGSIGEIKRLELFSYLGLLVQMTVDSINSMKSMKMKPVDVADRLHLKVEQVTPFFTDSEQ